MLEAPIDPINELPRPDGPAVGEVSGTIPKPVESIEQRFSHRVIELHSTTIRDIQHRSVSL